MENMENNYTIETVEDEYRHKWVESVYGSGETLIFPDDIYGIMIDAFPGCEEVKKIWIPASVKEVANNAFSSFEGEVVIYCEADEMPSGWFYQETGMTTCGFGANMTFDVLVTSWQGRYVYTCDADDRIISSNNGYAQVVWGSKLEDVK